MTKRRLVVKVGTGFLFDRTDENGYSLRTNQIDGLVDEASLISKTNDIVIVSSGAIAMGCIQRDLNRKPDDIHEKAELSGIGQPYLMNEYTKRFGAHGKTCAQILLCADDLEIPKQRENLLTHQEGYFRRGIIAVCNENDLAATEEITFGDNDILAALWAVGIQANLLVMLSDPKEGVGTGGGSSKEKARKILDAAGIQMEILNGAYARNVDTGLYLPKIREALK